MSRLQSSGAVSGAISCCWSECLLLHALPYLVCSKMHTFNKSVIRVALVSLVFHIMDSVADAALSHCDLLKM